MKKNTASMHGENFYQLHTETMIATRRNNDSCRDILIIGKNRSLRNRENLHYKKTSDLVLLGLFLRTNGKGGRV